MEGQTGLSLWPRSQQSEKKIIADHGHFPDEIRPWPAQG